MLSRAWRGILVIIFFAWPLVAPSLDPLKPPVQYRLQVWASRDGLPQDTVSALVQTRDGYLWLGTEEGLARFDGLSFTVFDKTNVEGLRNNHVTALCEDGAGALWMGTWGGDLFRCTGGRFSDGSRGVLVKGGVWALAAGGDGSLWIGTSEGLLRWRGDAHEVLGQRDGLSSGDVRALCTGPSGDLWIGTRAGLCRWSRGHIESWEGRAGCPKDVASLLLARDGTLWMGGAEGLFRLRGDRTDHLGAAEGLPNAGVRALCEDRNGALWVATNGAGLVRLVGRRVQDLGRKEGLPDDALSALCEDREGSLWVGTLGGGLARLSEGKIVPTSSRQGLAGDVARVICEDSQGVLWIGTGGGGLSRLAGESFSTMTKKNGLSSDAVRSLWPSRNGGLWVGTEGGLDLLTGGRVEHPAAAKGLAGAVVPCLLEDRSGALWAGTSGKGLAKLEGGRLTFFTKVDGLPDNDVWCLREDARGRLWVGTNGGLACLEGGHFRAYHERDGLSCEVILSVYESEAGVLWFGTGGGGLVRFKEGRFAPCTRRNGLFDDVVFQMLPDGAGDLWMSCNRGIFKTPQRDLGDFADGRRPGVSCVAFGRSDGMLSNECNGGGQPAGCRSRDGRLWFPTNMGIVAVDPTKLPRNPLAPPVIVESVLADGKPVPAEGLLSVPPGTRRLEFRYAGLSLRVPEQVKFRCRLEGFDAGWIEAGTSRAAYYTNLRPGRYRFIVTACNEDGVWNARGASLAVRLLPRFYQTTLFAVLCALLAITCAAAGYRLRVRQLKARESRLVALVSERTAQLHEANLALEARSEELSEANLELEERGLELESANRQLTELSHRDSLTGVANRRHFEAVLDSEWRRCLRSGASLSLLMADVDSFKHFNDTLGHPAGDECLRCVASALRSGLKRAGDLLARYGGEEFVVILPDMNLAGATALAEDLRACVQALRIAHDGAPAAPIVTVSLGVASCRPAQGGAPPELVQAADRALYRAKEGGRNRVESALPTSESPA